MRGPPIAACVKAEDKPTNAPRWQGPGDGGLCGCAGCRRLRRAGKTRRTQPCLTEWLGARQAGNSSLFALPKHTDIARRLYATVPCSRSSLVILRVRRKQISSKNRTAGLSGRGWEASYLVRLDRSCGPQRCFVPIFVCFSVDRGWGPLAKHTLYPGASTPTNRTTNGEAYHIGDY